MPSYLASHVTLYHMVVGESFLFHAFTFFLLFLGRNDSTGRLLHWPAWWESRPRYAYTLTAVALPCSGSWDRMPRACPLRATLQRRTNSCDARTPSSKQLSASRHRAPSPFLARQRRHRHRGRQRHCRPGVRRRHPVHHLRRRNPRPQSHRPRRPSRLLLATRPPKTL